MFASFHEVVFSEFEEAWLIPKLHVCLSLACKNTQFWKRFENSVTACTVLFQPSMLPVISKQQLDFVFQKYIQINFKYRWEIKIAFLQNFAKLFEHLKLLGLLRRIWSNCSIIQQWGLLCLRTSQGCFVWAVCRTSCFRDCPSIRKALLGPCSQEHSLCCDREQTFPRKRLFSWSSWAPSTGK